MGAHLLTTWSASLSPEATCLIWTTQRTSTSRAAFNRAARLLPSFRSLTYAYVQAFLEQVLVSVACNGAHTLGERLARWLLMMRDRSDQDELPITWWSFPRISL